MKYLKLYEDYNKSLELKNDLQNHLSQYSFLSYDIKDDGENVILTFNKDVSYKYGTGLLNSFEKEVIEKYPLKVKVTSVKDLDDYQEFKGKTIIQNIEKVNFPDLGLKDIEAKCDSGATTSSIGVSKIKIDRQTKKVSFIPLNPKFEGYVGKIITKPIHSEITVQNSFGETETRCMISSDIIIKGKTYGIFISLSDRESLNFSILLGKDILSNFLLQPGK